MPLNGEGVSSLQLDPTTPTATPAIHGTGQLSSSKSPRGMVDLPPPSSSLRSEKEAVTAVEAVEPVVAEEATEAIEAGAPDSGGSPTSGDAPEGETPKKKRKAFRAIEIANQIHQVQEWLTQGKRPNQIRQLCSEEWGLETRVAEHRIQDARRQMVTDANVMDRPEKVGQMLQQLEQVLEQALAMKQGSNAIGALRLQADLLQLLTRQN